MVTVVHAYNRFHSSEIRCFVNGKVVSTGETTLVHANEVSFMPRKVFIRELAICHNWPGRPIIFPVDFAVL